ncbi:hepatic lectin-like [Mixophyes fleayi]|uniref:hepatic lectin-like n=1 Tax=Mixophyes fleayi TaxID=3061075 RepID=UPI003F4E2D91
MESDSASRYSDFKYSATRWYYFYRQKPEWISYGLLMILYVLILALFITVFSGSTATSLSQSTVSKTEVDAFKNKVIQVSSLIDQLKTSVKKKPCEVGWLHFDDSCYYLSLVKSNWQKARDGCIKKEADLAVITSEREQIFLNAKSNAGVIRRFWIGLHDIDEEGAWTWVDGSNYETSYKFWKEGEPNDHLEGEDCGHMWTNGEWNDVPCTYDQCYAICEKKL